MSDRKYILEIELTEEDINLEIALLLDSIDAMKTRLDEIGSTICSSRLQYLSNQIALWVDEFMNNQSE